MKWKKIIFYLICILSFLIFIPNVFSQSAIYELRAQDEYAILTQRAVNFSFVINVTNTTLDSGLSMNCTVYNRSSITGGFSKLFVPMNVTNSTFVNRTITLTPGRTYWYINCTTRGEDETPIVTNATFISDERVLDIDLDYFTLSLGVGGVINFSLDSGNATFKDYVRVGRLGIGTVAEGQSNPFVTVGSGNFTGNLTMGGNTTFSGIRQTFIQFYNMSPNIFDCTADYESMILYNATEGTWIGCGKDLKWKKLNAT